MSSNSNHDDDGPAANAAVTAPNGGGGIITRMPTAPYPPMLPSATTRFPSAPLASMRSSPLYSASASSTTTTTAPAMSRLRESRRSTSDSVIVSVDNRATTSTTNSNSSNRADDDDVSKQTRGAVDETSSATALLMRHNTAAKQLPARVKFCHWDVLACINCCADSAAPAAVASASSSLHSSNINNARQSQQEQQQQLTAISSDHAAELANNNNNNTPSPSFPNTNSARKLGPLLMELRRLNFGRSDDETESSSGTNTNKRMFQTSTICQSRGNPSLGASVSSTCLDVAVGWLPAATSQQHRQTGYDYIPPCATGLTTGALCIHSFSAAGATYYGTAAPDCETTVITPSIEYYHMPRHHRPATAVAWRPTSLSHVAIGLTGQQQQQQQQHGTSIGAGKTNAVGTSNTASTATTSPAERQALQQQHIQRRPLQAGGAAAVGGGGGGVGGANNPGDREYCCFLWDIEHQSSASAATQQGASSTLSNRRTSNKTAQPLYKLSYNAGVASLGWIFDGGQTLVVGGQQRGNNLQLYDLRVSSASAAAATTSSAAPPVTIFAHAFGVHGIEVDPTRSWHFCTYSRAAGETAVKLWDARRMDSPLTEIKIGGGGASKSSAPPTTTTESAGNSLASLQRSSLASSVHSVKWSTLEPGRLSILIGDSLHEYDTLTSGSRPIHTNTIRMRKPIVDFTHCPFADLEHFDSKNSPSLDSATLHKKNVFAELLPKSIVAVEGGVGDQQIVSVVAAHRIAPIAVSQRTGQVIFALGRTLWSGSASEGPGAMEGPEMRPDEDISATMLRRARCLHVAKYSMDTSSNIKIIAGELSGLQGSSSSSVMATKEQLLRLWKWIQRAEALCNETTEDSLDWVSNWPAKSLIDAGVWKLLALDEGKPEQQGYFESLSCATYDSEGRRAALASCGWAGMFDLASVMADCEDGGEFERSAALAVWHGDIGAAVDALQRGADAYTQRNNARVISAKYGETLELVSLSIAGYRGSDSETASSGVWRKACGKLLHRPDLSDPSAMPSGAGYLRHVLKFLMTIGIDDSHKEVMGDFTLSLCDRVAFACRFLSGADLKLFLDKCISDCQSTGNVEGITVTGVEKKGIQILQSYVDVCSDIQTAALVTSRVVFPADWAAERRIAAEWLHAYRSLLNRWQMWQSRAMFDVDRADLLRKVKMRLSIEAPGTKPASRRMQPSGRRRNTPDPDVQATVPAQLDARCNYCSSPLGLRRQDNQPNQWLSKMKNVLPCCPQCRKPLPRCAICMLSLGALNPYMELTKERPRLTPRGGTQQVCAPDDLSSLANLPFAEWFSWCLRCKHGGHAHHMVGWFAKHEVCPVSGCNCHCQFDGISKLQRPALMSQQQQQQQSQQASEHGGAAASFGSRGPN